MPIQFSKLIFFGKKSIRIVFGFFIVFILGVLVGRSGILGTVKSHVYSTLKVSSETSRKISNYHQEKIDLFNALGIHSSEVLFIGDSLIDNGEWQELLSSHQVSNRGIQGVVTSDLLNLLPQIKLIRSTKVFVMAGVNDLRRGIKHEVVIANYSSLIDQLLESFEYVFIHSVLFGESNDKELNIKIMDLNSDLEKLSYKNKRVFFISLNPIISPEGYISKKYSYDGIHLNGKGYMVWRDAVRIMIDKTE